MPASSTRSAGESSRDQHRRDVLLAVLVATVGLAAVVIRTPADVALYHRYADEMVHQSLALGLPKEYPALAGGVFALALAIPVGYVLGFGVLMAACFAGLLAAGRRLVAGPGWTRRVLLYLGLGTVWVLFGRYDLLPAAAVLVAVLAARRDRWGTAWVAAVLGAALKLFPAVLLPGFFLVEWRRSGRPPWRRVGATAVAAVAVAGAQALVAPGTLLSPLRYELRRGFEFSSLPGSLTALIDPAHLHWVHAFGAWEVVGPGHAAIGIALTVVQLAALAALWAAAWRGRLGVDALSLAVLSAVVLGDRALAPQYLIWLAPLWALWPLRRSWVAAAVLTTLTYPVAFNVEAHLGASMLAATVVGAARNAVLLAGTGVWLWGDLRRRAETSHAPSQPTMIGGAMTWHRGSLMQGYTETRMKVSSRRQAHVEPKSARSGTWVAAGL